MKITLKDGSVKEYAESMSVLQIATDISEGLGRAACAGKVNGVVVDLRDEVSEDCELEILTFRDDEGKKHIDILHLILLAQAVKLCIRI